MNIVPPGINIDFLGKRRLFGGISVGAVLLSFALIAFIGPNYGIDFSGGTNIIVRFMDDPEPGEITSTMVDLGFDDAVVQRFGPSSDRTVVIQTNRISVITEEQAFLIRQALEEEFGAEGLLFEYDVESGDRIEVKLPEDAFADLLNEDVDEDVEAEEDASETAEDGTGMGTGESVVEDEVVLPDDLEPQELQLTRTLLTAGLDDPRVTLVGNPRHNRFLIRLQDLQRRVGDGLIAHFGEEQLVGTGAEGENIQYGIQRVESVGPRVGEQLRNQGIKAVVLALFFILVYIGLRFNMRFAPAAVVALFHDVTITLGIFVILQEEITLTILAALLTIVGYSLNDTIVVFDRIRENVGTLRTKDLPTIVNQSINECLSRTLLTSLTTMLAVLSLYFLGGGLVQSFALAMIIGILVGTYSSIYVASPVMIALHDALEKRNAKKKQATRIVSGRRS